MKKLLIGILIVFSCQVYAEAIANMPNKANGKIVLTNEICKYNNKTYNTLKRAYYYTESGYTSEGCFYMEDDTIVVIWDGGIGKEASTMRYPVENFIILKKKISYKGTAI